MKLYRARTIASRPSRHPAYEGNTPQSRIAGRWFTSSRERAEAHRRFLDGATEIVCIEIADNVATSMLVATTPNTKCGLNPGSFSDMPSLDYVVPLFWVMQAQTYTSVQQRKIDRIDVKVIDISAQIAARKLAKAA